MTSDFPVSGSECPVSSGKQLIFGLSILPKPLVTSVFGDLPRIKPLTPQALNPKYPAEVIPKAPLSAQLHQPLRLNPKPPKP